MIIQENIMWSFYFAKFTRKDVTKQHLLIHNKKGFHLLLRKLSFDTLYMVF